MTDNENGTGPVIRDRRRLDPETGKVREAYGVTETAPSPAGDEPAGEGLTVEAADEPGGTIADPAVAGGPTDDVAALQALAAERLDDLQRVSAEYANYRRRVERDRDVARGTAIAAVLEALLPVLDDVHLARQHGDLGTGPFVAIADKLESTLSRFGLARYGEPGETFDPAVHEALIHTEAELAEGTTDTTVVQVLQPGYRSGERVLRAARVAVADPK